MAKKYVYSKCIICGRKFGPKEVPDHFRLEELPDICSECKSKYGLEFPEVEVEKEEQEIELSLDKPHDTLTIKCPKCGHKITIWCLFSKKRSD